MEERVTKKRASRACTHCRSRKVRCDVVTGGVPCTNCRLDYVTCKLADSVRARRTYQRASISKSPISVPLEPIRTHSTPQEQSDEFPVSLTFEDQMGLGHGADGHDEDCHSASARSAAFGSSQGSTGCNSQRLPAYIKPLPPHIRAEDMEYLARKDALTIPADELRNELLRYYIKIMHPSMPILDINQFVTPILKPGSGSPVSLLLFQAVMFVGISFVDIGILRCHGYTCRRSARKRFFNRVRLLYGLDCEPDRFALLQSLLFMTFWYDTPEDEKDTWHWMGITLSLAQVMGIHRDPTHMGISVEAKRHRIRLWWACLMRDRLLALGIRRPARVKPDDYNVRMLRLDDFEMGPLSDEVARLLGNPALLNNQELFRTLAETCIELAKLCLCIGHILLSQYSILPSTPGSTGEYLSSIMVFPRNSEQQNKELETCDQELGEWFRNLSAGSRYTVHGSNVISNDDEATQITKLQQASLHMIYLTALGILHRPQIFRRPSTLGEADSMRSLSRHKVTDAAIRITQLAYEMQMNDQLRYLSTSSVPAFVSAALIHLFDIRSTLEDVRNTSIGRFFQCMQALRQLQDMYASADYAVYFLESVIQKTGIQVPMLSLSPSLPRRGSFAVSRGNMAQQKGYPISPSSSGHQPAEEMSTSIIPPSEAGPLSVSLDLQGPGTMQIVETPRLPVNAIGTEMFPSGNAAQPRAQVDGWNEIDTLLYAFINFESDPGLVLTPAYEADV